MSWLITIAMPAEAELLTRRWQQVGDIGGRPAYEGGLAGQKTLLVLTGMGQVNAAQAASAALEAAPEVEAVFNLGCAGAYENSGLSVGQAALASEVVSADLGVQTTDYLHGLDKVGIPLGQHPEAGEIYNRLPCDRSLNIKLRAANPGLVQGAFATVGRISGDAEAAAAQQSRWDALIEEMEAAAVGLVALHYEKPFSALRGVSNIAGRRELDVAAGAEAAQKALLALEAAS